MWWENFDWIEEWKRFFDEERVSRLRAVLHANGCREGWLQGEAVLHFRNLGVPFYCNYAHITANGGKKADFAAYSSERRNAALRFIGECKVLGAGYQHRTLGIGVRELRQRYPDEEPIVIKFDPNRSLGGNSLIGDYDRLVRATYANNETTRMLMLVLDKTRFRNPAETTGMGQILSRLQFEQDQPEIHIVGDEVEVRGWRIHGQKAAR